MRVLRIAGLLQTRNTDLALVPLTLYPRIRPSRNQACTTWPTPEHPQGVYILTATRTWSRRDEWRTPAIGTAASCTWFLEEKGKKERLCMSTACSSSLLATWSISGKDCVATCNLKLCSSYWGMLTRFGAFWAQMLTTILPVTPHATQETTFHQQPLQQRFSPLPQ